MIKPFVLKAKMTGPTASNFCGWDGVYERDRNGGYEQPLLFMETTRNHRIYNCLDYECGGVATNVKPEWWRRD